MPIFPKLEVQPPKQSHHNRSHYFRTSMAPGYLVPIYCRNVVAGDEINLDFESLVNTQALLSPLYGSYVLQIDTFFSGTSLYVPQLWRNGSMRQADGTQHAPYPTFKLYTTANSNVHDNLINPSSLLAYLGFPPGYSPLFGRQYNAIPLLMYADIFRHYYANRQEVTFPTLRYQSNGKPIVVNFQLSLLDNLFLNLPSAGGDITLLLKQQGLASAFEYTQALSGMFLKTYKPDMMNVVLNDTFYSQNVSSVTVSTAGDRFQVDQLVTAKKLWNSRNKDVMSSGTFKDWVRLHYGVTPKIMDDMPTFCGSTSTDIVFEDIRATTSATLGDGEQYLGDKAASGLGFLRSRRHRVIADRPGYVMAIASIVPRVDYFQRLERYTQYTDIADEFRPEYNGIGLQDALVSDFNADFSRIDAPVTATFTDPSTASLGKQPAWIEYMTAVNKVRGTFCTTERSWVLSRNMMLRPSDSTAESQPTQNTNISAYVIPDQWASAFALSDVTAQNFLAQFNIKDYVRSSVLKRLLPKF